MLTIKEFRIIPAVFVFLSILSSFSPAEELTIKELADICEKMESAIEDISLEYEYHIIGSRSLEAQSEGEFEAEQSDGQWQRSDYPWTKKLSAAGMLDQDGNVRKLPEMMLVEKTVKNPHRPTQIRKASWNGRVGKALIISERPSDSGELRKEGRILAERPSHILHPPQVTPIAIATVLRFAYLIDGPLSDVLRDGPDRVRLDSKISTISGFDTIRADILHVPTGRVIQRVYFSVNHGYTPVRYEYMRGDELGTIAEVGSLEEVAEGLCFPSSGQIMSKSDGWTNLYIATSEILVNQGLTREDFDIEFPPGTVIVDEIKRFWLAVLLAVAAIMLIGLGIWRFCRKRLAKTVKQE